VAGGGWWLVVGGGWWLVAGGWWWLVAGGEEGLAYGAHGRVSKLGAPGFVTHHECFILAPVLRVVPATSSPAPRTCTMQDTRVRKRHINACTPPQPPTTTTGGQVWVEAEVGR
jgi:hypothetical protein